MERKTAEVVAVAGDDGGDESDPLGGLLERDLSSDVVPVVVSPYRRTLSIANASTAPSEA